MTMTTNLCFFHNVGRHSPSLKGVRKTEKRKKFHFDDDTREKKREDMTLKRIYETPVVGEKGINGGGFLILSPKLIFLQNIHPQT